MHLALSIPCFKLVCANKL